MNLCFSCFLEMACENEITWIFISDLMINIHRYSVHCSYAVYSSGLHACLSFKLCSAHHDAKTRCELGGTEESMAYEQCFCVEGIDKATRLQPFSFFFD